MTILVTGSAGYLGEALMRSLSAQSRPARGVGAERGWKMFPTLDRVYVNERARRELGWQPRYGFPFLLDCLRENGEWRSPLALDVGSRGYHDEDFAEGPYPVDQATA